MFELIHAIVFLAALFQTGTWIMRVVFCAAGGVNPKNSQPIESPSLPHCILVCLLWAAVFYMFLIGGME